MQLATFQLWVVASTAAAAAAVISTEFPHIFTHFKVSHQLLLHRFSEEFEVSSTHYSSTSHAKYIAYIPRKRRE
jgi:hypothetical protein